MRNSWRGCVLAALILVLAGCTETSTVGERVSPAAAPASAQSPPPPSSTPTSLAAQKRAARIEDCPPSDPAAAAVPGGLPDITLPCLGGGREVRLAGLRGRPMLVNVWAQWCGPCRSEAPYLAAVAREQQSELLILGVDYVDGVQPDKAIAFARAAGWTYPQVADPDKALAGPLQIVGPPYTFFVRADGTVAGKHVGAFTSADQIRTLVKQRLGVQL